MDDSWWISNHERDGVACSKSVLDGKSSDSGSRRWGDRKAEPDLSVGGSAVHGQAHTWPLITGETTFDVRGSTRFSPSSMMVPSSPGTLSFGVILVMWGAAGTSFNCSLLQYG